MVILLYSIICFTYSVFSEPLTEPWIDTIPIPEITYATIPIYSADVNPVTNAFNRFISIRIHENSTLINTGSSCTVKIIYSTF